MRPLRKCRECGLEAHTEEELESFAIHKSYKYGRASICKECHKKECKKWREDNRDYALKTKQERVQRNREALKEYIGGVYRCQHCGFEHTTSSPFDFHHINPKDKEGTVGELVSKANLDKLFREVDKCVFLCKNCHAIEHERLRANE